MLELRPGVREAVAPGFEEARRAGGLDRVGAELFALAALTAREPLLRKSVAESSVPAGARRALLDELLGGRALPATLSILGDLLEAPRLRERELPGLLDALGAQAVVEAADADGGRERLEDELFRFARTVETNGDLRAALADEALPLGRRRAVVEDLVGGRSEPRLAALVGHLLDRGYGRGIEEAVRTALAIAAARREAVLAEARSAIPLDPERQERLRAALAAAVGRAVELRVTVDPAVIGSLSVRVGDEVFDGSVRRQLAHAREVMGAS